ncbi:hypothetical protein IJ00_13770 [Calothrix sp. 336/3]|nr:hypothetical protein IJ00_13770 [Calothrix sp. 336/3]
MNRIESLNYVIIEDFSIKFRLIDSDINKIYNLCPTFQDRCYELLLSIANQRAKFSQGRILNFEFRIWIAILAGERFFSPLVAVFDD